MKQKTTKTAAASEQKPIKPDFAEQVRSFVAEWSVTIILLLFGTTTLLQAFVVPTGSMEDTVLIGDHMFVDKLSYSPHGPLSNWLLPYTDVKRGDIIVFKYPLDRKKDFVKRLVGLPGDQIEIREGKIFVNGNAVEEGTFSDRYYYNAIEGQLGKEGQVVVVPEDSYFVLGDNSAHSSDSRVWGFVPKRNLIGKAFVIWWPPQRVKFVK